MISIRNLVGVLVAALALTACGAQPSGSATYSQVPPPPSPDPYTSALIMTKTWAAAEIEATADSTIDGAVSSLRGVGEVAIDKGYGEIEWSGSDSAFRELVNDRAIFTRPEAPAALWVRTDSSGRTPTSAFTNPLVNLTRLDDVSRDGDEEMDGFTAETYRGTLPITARNLEGLVLTDAEVAELVAAALPSDMVVVRVWVDPNHRLVRIDRSLKLSGAPTVDVHASSHLFNFGVMLDLAPPPSASVSVPQ
ncbi:MAG: hypothetical protein PSX37_01160 [bacterium]|nr:hypothetical protein [bacterium]